MNTNEPNVAALKALATFLMHVGQDRAADAIWALIEEPVKPIGGPVLRSVD